MKKFLTCMLTSMFLMIIVSSCNKDIPDWLVEKIKHAKKELKAVKKKNGTAFSWVAEYSDGSVTLYRYKSPRELYGYTYCYDLDGNEICSFNAGMSGLCGYYSYSEIMDFYKVRMIWSDN